MKSADYIAVVRLTTKDEKVLAMPGKSCERVPEASLPWLLADGLIRPAKDEKPAPKSAGRTKGRK